MAEQRIQLAEARAKAIATQDGPQIDFSADMERQKMSAEGLMGPFALNDPVPQVRPVRGTPTELLA